MKYQPEKVLALIQDFVKEMKEQKQVDSVEYRKDYQDYRCAFTDNTHCEIRQKLVDVYIDNNSKEARKEIEFRIKHAVPWEEFE